MTLLKQNAKRDRSNDVVPDADPKQDVEQVRLS